MNARSSRTREGGPAELLGPVVIDPTVTGVGRLPMRPLAVPCPDAATARRSPDEGSPWWRSLDGEWQFRMLGSPDELTAADVEPGTDGDWDRIEVPGAWTLQRGRDGEFDRPHYTNVVMPFDADPPAFPAENPTGVYRRSVTVPREWRGRRCVLRIGAAESTVSVWVDGRFVGSGSDSRLPSEFDLSPYVRAGRRSTIVLVVTKWSAHTWLEDQDQWWHGGIQRSVAVYSTAENHLAGIRALPGLVAGDSGTLDTGTIDATVNVAGPAVRELGWTVELSVETLGKPGSQPGERGGPRQLASTGSLPVPMWDASSEPAQLLSGMFVEPGAVRATLTVPRIDAWTHETPHRYRLLVTLRDAAGEVVETTALVIGFRSVEVRDRELLINGRPVLFHGVNLHEHDTRRGRAVGRELTRADLLAMKANNLNAVRAAHYPHDEHLAELCDELGLYLVDEANVETHARQISLCHDPRYATGIVERVQRMVQRDAHHPSIILWSLGNESGDGAAHAAAAAWVRHHDPTRPLHYEGPLMHDLHAAAPVTDVVCPMYPTIDAIVDWARSGRDQRRPLIMCEYSHAMGNSNGSLADYWDAIRAHHGLQGGFIWEWLEHGLPLAGTAPGGRTEWGYGGDFGDTPNDSNFVCDGLVAADRTPHPAMAEVHWIGRPVETSWAGRGRRIRVTSRRWFTGLDDLVARWSLTVDGTELESGELDVGPVEPGASVDIAAPFRAPRLRPGQEAHLTVTWSQRAATPWARRGHAVARDQLEVEAAASRGATRSIGVTLSETDAAPPLAADPLAAAPTLFRALTDNDGIRAGWMRGLSGNLARWVDEQGLDRCTWDPGALRRRSVDGSTVTTSVGHLVAPGVDEPVVVRRRVEERPDGWTNVRFAFQVPGALADPPRLGVEWMFPRRRRLEWLGDGPHECYPDRRAAATVGRWKVAVEDTYVDYVVPQEHGHRTGMRWLALDDLLVVADPLVGSGTLGFAARAHSDRELWAARHTSELTDPAEAASTVLYLDVAQRGLGTASCGPDTLGEYRIGAGRHTLSVWCRTLGRGEDPAQLAETVRARTG